MKKNFLVLFIIFTISLSFGITTKDYENLTESDRIRLAISYYEVGTTYKSNNKIQLGDSYIKESYKIEPNVKKYIDGELEIPRKVINIDLSKIFEDDSDINQDNQSNSETNNSEIKYSKKEENLKVESNTKLSGYIWTDFINRLSNNNADEASSFFANEVYIKELDVYITKDEIKETIKGWIENKSSIPQTKSYVLNQNTIQVDFIENIEYFIFPIKNNKLLLEVSKVDGKYLISKIYSE